MTHCRQTSRGQIISVNVISENIIRRNQRRQAFLQTLNGQTIGRVNTRCAQNRHAHTGSGAPLAQITLGINPPPGTRTFWIQAPRFVNPRPCTIAVNTRRAYVNKLAW